ncbi:hypothetical protein SUSAZ_04365 [Sulfolobus acidocaldarius SUSAZ]|nr:hypothetical protein SUSAZ_04365 [Sulfolobus acidocaldarius SUSAZ]
MDDDFLSYLLAGENKVVRRYATNDDLILKRLDEIERLIRGLNMSKSPQKQSLCEQILEKGYIVTDEHIRSTTHPQLFILPVGDNSSLITFKDTMDLLLVYFRLYKNEVDNKLPKRLLNIYSFLKKNGLIYLDHEDMMYKLI